jgi:biuret amidohydrolase
MKNAYGLNIPYELADLCNPNTTAVVIYDLQVGIVPQIPAGKAIVEGCKTLVDQARGAGFRIFYTRHISLPNKSSGVAQLRRAMIWQRKDDPAATKSPFLPNAAGTQIVPELQPHEDDVVIDKIAMSAFEGTYLNTALRDLGVLAFVVAGIALEVGIEPTVRHALDLNYIPIVISDLCGARTPELHAHSIETLKHTGEVFLTSSQEWLQSLKESRQG